MYICVSCKKIFQNMPGIVCPICGGMLFAEEKIAGESPDSYKFFTADFLIKRKLNLKKLDGFEFMGELPKRWQLLISGPPGQGKSTFCLRLCKKLAETKKVLYWSFEEKFNDTLVMKLKLNNITGNNIVFTAVDNFEDFLSVCSCVKPNCIVIDSLNDAAVETIQIKRIKRIGVSISIYIAHFTKDEKTYKGDSSIKHEVDIYAEIKNFEVTLKKNRVGKSTDLNRPFSIFGEENTNVNKIAEGETDTGLSCE